MKQFYAKFRIMLLTCAFGLASVFVLQGSLHSNDIEVDLPKTESESVFVVFPKKKVCMPFPGGSHDTTTQNERMRR